MYEVASDYLSDLFMVQRLNHPFQIRVNQRLASIVWTMYSLDKVR